jgi:hypothetical protein
MVTAGLAAAVLAVVLLLPGTRKAPAPEAATAALAAPHPAPAGPPAAGAPHPGPSGDAAVADMHQGLVDENTRAMLAYPVTVARLKAYIRAVKEVRAAGERDAALLARLREPRPKGEAPAGMAARLEAIPPLKSILRRHGLTGLDLVLMPQAMVAGRFAYALEQEGRPLPPDEVNAAVTALFRADLPAMDELNKAYLDDLKFLNGR